MLRGAGLDLGSCVTIAPTTRGPHTKASVPLERTFYAGKLVIFPRIALAERRPSPLTLAGARTCPAHSAQDVWGRQLHLSTSSL